MSRARVTPCHMWFASGRMRLDRDWRVFEPYGEVASFLPAATVTTLHAASPVHPGPSAMRGVFAVQRLQRIDFGEQVPKLSQDW
jgi:hypothetical protein